METSVREVNSISISRKINSNWSYLYNYLSNLLRRIWLGGTMMFFLLMKGIESKQLLSVGATNLANKVVYVIDVIYASMT